MTNKRKPVRRKQSPARSKGKTTIDPNQHPNGAPRAVAPKIETPADSPRPSAHRRLLPSKTDLGALYQRYTKGAAFDDHDKAFYFVLDVGGVSRARQLLAHVEEVLTELEEFRE
jgi:hypothetical protein